MTLFCDANTASRRVANVRGRLQGIVHRSAADSEARLALSRQHRAHRAGREGPMSLLPLKRRKEQVSATAFLRYCKRAYLFR